MESSESPSSAPPSATIAVMSTTTTVTTSVIPLTTSANITLTGFRWTGLPATDKNLKETVTPNNVSGSMPQSPSIVSRIRQLYSQQEMTCIRKNVGLDDDDRRLSLISSDKCERDESGRSLCYSSSDDTQSLATTTSATGNL